MAVSGPKSGGEMFWQINITPLTDIFLVLLIIFMVVAPRMDQDVQVDLPGIFNPDPEMETSVDPLKVTVARSGEYYINDQKYGLDDAIELVEQKRRGEKSELSEVMRARWAKRLPVVFSRLDEAVATSSLPESPPNELDIEDWLVTERLAHC